MSQNNVIEKPLKQFVVEAIKKMDGDSLVVVIKEALNCVDASVFATLLECPNVIALETTHHAPYYFVLQCFLRGTYLNYLKNKEYLPVLSERQIKILQYLTIVTLANKIKLLSYDLLLHELNVNNVKDLENLIIEAIHLNLISGKLNKKYSYLEINWTVTRHVGANDVDNEIDTIEPCSYIDSSENVLSTVESCIVDANQTKQSVPKGSKCSAPVENELARLKKITTTQMQGEEMSVDTY